MRLCGLALLILLFSIAPELCRADQIVLNNAAFTTLSPGGLTSSNSQGSWDLTGVPGWTSVGSGYFGTFAPIVGAGTFNSLPDGPDVAFVTGGYLQQDATTVQAGEKYTLSVDVGDRLDMPSTASVALYINGVSYTATGVAPAPGGWSTYTVNYTALSQDVGAQIYIRLIGNGQQADFQDV
jgi:hypothetical protein